MEIRQSTPKDYDAIHDFVWLAFQTAEMPFDNEHEAVRRWRASDNYIPELELVAEENGEIIGHIMFQKLYIKNDNSEFVGLLLAPLAVKLEYRNKGIGEKLVYAGFEKAKGLGYSSAFLAGNPKYYNRFGFKEIGEFGLENKTEIPNQFVLGCEIIDGSLEKSSGYIDDLE